MFLKFAFSIQTRELSINMPQPVVPIQLTGLNSV